MSFNYRIAISYSGKNREYVRKVCQYLNDYLTKDEFFYDEIHEALTIRPNPEKFLREVYSNKSQIVVVFLSEEFDNSRWCQLERSSVVAALDSGQLESDQVMPFSFGSMNTGGTLQLDGTKDIERDTVSPEECGKLIVDRLADLEEEKPSKRQKPWSKPSWSILLPGLILFGFMVFAALYPQVFPENWELDESLFGVGAVLVLLALLAMLPLIGRKRIPLVFSKALADPADESNTQTVEELTELCKQWQNYSAERESYHTARHQIDQDSLSSERIFTNTMLASIIIYVLAHVLGELCLRHLGHPFLTSLNLLEYTKSDNSGNFLELYKNSYGNIGLAAIYFTCSLVIYFLFGRKKNHGAFLIGFVIPSIIGLIWVTAICSQDYDKYFPKEGGKDFLGQFGNLLYLERVLIIPVLCYAVVQLISLITKRKKL